MYEHKNSPLLPRSVFFARLLKSFVIGTSIIALVLCVGVLCFHHVEQLSWIDSFFQASMFFAGLGPVFTLVTWWGKLLASFYAILCPFTLVASISILLFPLLHRFLHKFHIDKENS